MSDNESKWPDSLWYASAEPLEELPGLKSDLTTDVLIIGAGYTGLSAALHLAESRDGIVVIDAIQPGWGCSGRNGGQINPNWKTSLSKLQKLYRAKQFEQFIETVDQSANLVFDLIERYNIQCEARRAGCLLASKGRKGYRYLKDWTDFWQARGAAVKLLDAQSMTEAVGCDEYDTGFLDFRGGSLQPLSYARGLARACMSEGVSIYGDTKALEVTGSGDRWRVKTASAVIDCNQVIFATNGYTDKLWPGLAQSIVPVASMLIATKPLTVELASRIIPQRYAVAEYSGVPPYYRIDELNRMVFGWRGTLSGSIGSLHTRHLKRKAVQLFPELEKAEWEYDWAGYVAITSHQRPMLLQLADHAFAGLGYNGRGIAMATMMGKQLAKVINNEETSLPLESCRQIPFHRFRQIGITTRIITGHLRDRFTLRL